MASGEETDYTVGSDAAITDEHKKDVFVFDEDFLRDNVKAYLKPEVVAEIETWKGEEDGWISFG